MVPDNLDDPKWSKDLISQNCPQISGRTFFLGLPLLYSQSAVVLKLKKWVILSEYATTTPSVKHAAATRCSEQYCSRRTKLQFCLSRLSVATLAKVQRLFPAKWAKWGDFEGQNCFLPQTYWGYFCHEIDWSKMPDLKFVATRSRVKSFPAV